jgi:zinc protease
VFACLAGVALAGTFPYPVHEGVLPNGLRWVAVPMPTPGVASVATWMAVGSRDEVEPGRTGFAHFFEHLWFYGTTERGGLDRERAIVRLGGEENAWTWFDETVYHLTVSSDRVPEALVLQGEVFAGLHLTADDVRREAGAVYGEYRKGVSNPDNRLSEALYALAFTRHTYGHDTIGTEADIAAMPGAYDHALAFFDRFYRPAHATVLVAGDIRPEDVSEAVARAFGGWQAGSLPRPPIPVEPKQTAARSTDVAWATETAPRLALGWPIPGHRPDDAELAALELAAALLLSPTGALTRRLVRDEALAYEVDGGRDSFVDPCLFQIRVTAREGADLARIEAVVADEVAALARGVDPAALDAVRARLAHAFVSDLDTPDGAVSALGWALRRGGGVDAVDVWYDTLSRVDGPAVSAAVSARLGPVTRNAVRLQGPR